MAIGNYIVTSVYRKIKDIEIDLSGESIGEQRGISKTMVNTQPHS